MKKTHAWAFSLLILTAACGGGLPTKDGDPSHPSASTQTLSVLTFNVWALPGYAESMLKIDTKRTARLGILCEELKKGTWDVVLLQEIWANSEQELLNKCGYPEVVDLDTADAQSGLMILSRHPIEESEKLVFDMTTSEQPYIAEAMVKKGALLAKIAVNGTKAIWVVNTHLAANYSTVADSDGKRGPRHEELRRHQMKQLVSRVSDKTNGFSEPVIVGGDFNLGPSSSEKLWDELTEKDFLKGFRAAPGVDGLATYEVSNTNAKANEGKLDHLFSSSGSSSEPSPGLIPISGKLVFTDPVRIDPSETLEMHLSDHFGFETTFKL